MEQLLPLLSHFKAATEATSKNNGDQHCNYSKIRKNENDDWFMNRHEELKALHEDLSQTLESFKAVTKSKDSLRGKSADVKGILSTILAGLKIHLC